jgi:hypothetical protein
LKLETIESESGQATVAGGDVERFVDIGIHDSSLDLATLAGVSDGWVRHGSASGRVSLCQKPKSPIISGKSGNPSAGRSLAEWKVDFQALKQGCQSAGSALCLLLLFHFETLALHPRCSDPSFFLGMPVRRFIFADKPTH